ncbi:MAG: DNA cytosine methyltransferase [Candidatus Thiodiazotropha taylori]|nr:DNA cytosine methyltransferase [Candidatus Thiodiazotropha taylori]
MDKTSLHKKRGSRSRGRKWPTAVDLYCGSGAVSQALKQTHYRVVAAVDNDPDACKTYGLNHPRVALYEEDIHRVSPTEILKSNLDGKPLDLLVVCAPCQPFSSQNSKRGNPKDQRRNLILESVRFAEILKPKAIFFENVAGLTTAKFGSLLTKLGQDLEALGYTLEAPQRVDAASFGVPQRRLRCIMIAHKANHFAIKDLADIRDQVTTVRDAIGNLPRLSSGEACGKDPLHSARVHSDLTLKRLKLIPRNGGSRFSLPKELELECHKGFKGHPDVYGRMKWDDVAPTLTTGCTDLTRGRYAHPEQDRSITVREAALLQTFPRDYVFVGSSGSLSRQIGNAVPVLMAHKIFKSIRPILLD